MKVLFGHMALIFALTLSLTSTAVAGDKGKIGDFIRVKKTKAGGQVAQLSVRTYKRAKGAKAPSTGMPGMSKKKFKYPEVVMVSIVHFAEAKYYKAINKTLADCDLVLYEAMGYDYVKAANLNKMGARELLFQGQGLKKTKTWELADLALNSQQRALGLPKGTMEMQMGQMGRIVQMMGEQRFRNQMMTQFKSMQGIEKLMNMKFILMQRNSVAFGKLVESIYKGKAKKIAIVYGGAHMPNLEDRLKDELNYVPVKTKWLNAIHDKKDAPVAKPPVKNKKAKLY